MVASLPGWHAGPRAPGPGAATTHRGARQPCKTRAVAITTIGLDGDDTLWHSESHFAVTTARLVELLEPWVPASASAEEHLIEVERRNLGLLGYGVKAFTLSMVETAIEVSDAEVPASAIRSILDWGKELLDHPVELLEDVAETVDDLVGSYQLVLVTKGDLFHQESKLARSGLAEAFTGIEIVSEKDPATYRRILGRHDVAPEEFVMVGNSVRSDVLPVLEVGARAVHVPYHVTWALEVADPVPEVPTLRSLAELRGVLASWSRCH
jgi:putative hydrolase of the HAD superfamily